VSIIGFLVAFIWFAISLLQTGSRILSSISFSFPDAIKQKGDAFQRCNERAGAFHHFPNPYDIGTRGCWRRLAFEAWRRRARDARYVWDSAITRSRAQVLAHRPRLWRRLICR